MYQYEEIVNNVETGFIKPKYLQQKIQYVTDKKNAEVCISTRHTFGDYLVVGIIALQRSIENKSGNILVYTYNENENISETMGVSQNWGSSFHEVEVDAPIYIQVCMPVESIYQSLFKGELGELKVAGIGLNIVMALTMQFSELHHGIPKCIMNELKFNLFDDLDTAQQNAFLLIQKMTSIAVAGTFYNMSDY